MKKLISMFVIFVMVLSLSCTAFASEDEVVEENQTYSYYNPEGKIVTIITTRTNDIATSKVYVEGVLSQSAQVNCSRCPIELSKLPSQTSRSEVIVKYNGDWSFLESEDVSAVALYDGYAILEVPVRRLREIALWPQIEYLEVPRRLYFSVNQGKTASCITSLQRGIFLAVDCQFCIIFMDIKSEFADIYLYIL